MNYPEHPKLLYVSGPYRAKGEHHVLDNIMEARRVARELWKMGYAVICPHANTFLFGGDDIPDSVWLVGDFVMVERCDGIVMLERWLQSEGATGEREHAILKGVPRFYWPKDREHLERWVNE